LYFFYASNSLVNRLCLPSGLLNSLPDVKSSIELVSLIDFPDGLQCQSARLADILYSIRSGAKYVDVPVNNTLIKDCNLSKMKEQFSSCLEICKINKVKLRPVLEYRLHEVETVLKVAECLLNMGINEIISSTGKMADDFSDNVLICKEIQDKIGLGVTFGGSCFTKQQLITLENAKIKGTRIISPKVMDNIFGPIDNKYPKIK